LGYHIVAEQAYRDPPLRKLRTPALHFAVKYAHGNPVTVEGKNTRPSLCR